MRRSGNKLRPWHARLPAARARPRPRKASPSRVILALANHPWLLDRFAEEVATLELKPKPLAELLAFLTRTIFDRPGIGRERVAEFLAESRHGELLDRLAHNSAFKRLAFLQPETPREEVEEPFADLLYRWRALPALEREVWDAAPDLAGLSEAEFEHFAELQQQVANAGSRHAADDAGDREAEERFKAKIAEVLREKGGMAEGAAPRSPRRALVKGLAGSAKAALLLQGGGRIRDGRRAWP